MLPLRQSTASQVIVLGPFIDDTDFKTAATGLTIANTDIKLRKHGATSYVNKNAGGATHMLNGDYHLTLDATDTNTAGHLRVMVKMAGALQVWQDFEVLPDEVYDEGVNADGPLPRMGVKDQGIAQSASASGLVLRAGAAFANDVQIGDIALVHGATQLYWQSAVIIDNDLTTDAITVSPNWIVQPSGTIKYKILTGARATDAAGSRPQVDLREIVGGAVATPNVAGVLPVDVTHVDGNAQDIATQTTAAAVLADTGTDGVVLKAAGLAADAAAAISAKVHADAATTPIPADVKKINATTVNGDGSGTPWGP